MDEGEFDLFVQEANDELAEKQEALTKHYRMGQWDDFAYDAPSGQLRFKDKSGAVKVEADTLTLGSFSAKSESWQWAWANKSVPASVRKAAEKLKKLTKLTGMDVFETASFGCDEAMAWELVAVSVKFLDAQGCYSMPADSQGTLRVFVAIKDVRKTSK